MIAVSWGIGREIWSTSQTRTTFSSPCRNASPVIGSCNGCRDVTARLSPTPSSTHSIPFQANCSNQLHMITAVNLPNTKPWKKSWGCLPISVNRTVRGNAGQSKMETAGCVSTCRAEPNSKTTRTGTSRIWPCYTTTHPENVWDTERQQKQS